MSARTKKIIKLLTVILLPIILQAFASSRNKERSIKDINIEHLTSDIYITDEGIRRMLIKDPQSKNPIGLLKLNELEKILNEHTMIEKSEVYCTIDGILEAKVTHRQPIARILTNGNFSYMDRQGHEMPLSRTFSARVPLVSGSINNQNWHTIFELVSFIKEDDFLDKNITDIKIKPNGEFELKMRVPDFTILFGKFEDVELKKANLKAFYKQMEKSKSLNLYKIVNLKYSNQVVCIK